MLLLFAYVLMFFSSYDYEMQLINPFWTTFMFSIDKQKAPKRDSMACLLVQ